MSDVPNADRSKMIPAELVALGRNEIAAYRRRRTTRDPQPGSPTSTMHEAARPDHEWMPVGGDRGAEVSLVDLELAVLRRERDQARSELIEAQDRLRRAEHAVRSLRATIVALTDLDAGHPGSNP